MDIKSILKAAVKPFIQKKANELMEEPFRAHPGQITSQIAKVNIGGALGYGLATVSSFEEAIAPAVFALVNLVLLYWKEKKD